MYLAQLTCVAKKLPELAEGRFSRRSMIRVPYDYFKANLIASGLKLV